MLTPPLTLRGGGVAPSGPVRLPDSVTATAVDMPPEPQPHTVFGLLEPLFWPIVLGSAAVVAISVASKLLTKGTFAACWQRLRGRRERLGPSQFLSPYQQKEALLTPAEQRFYETLAGATGERRTICPKVRLADLVEVRRGTPSRTAYFRRISQKHVDFVICEGPSLVPVAVVELDDASHNSTRARKADAVKNAALEAAGLPLVRIRAARQYDTATVRATLSKSLRASADTGRHAS